MFRLFQLFLILICFKSQVALGSDSLNYSGRLVNTNGSPVPGPAKLKFDLAYTNDITDILCSDEINGVDLVNGVFHAKINFTCPDTTLMKVLEETPINNSIAIRVTDLTNATPKVYSFQALHSVPFTLMSNMTKQLVQMGAVNGQVLTWLNGQWVPQDSAGAAAISDGSVTGAKLNQMSASVGQVLKWTAGGWAPQDDDDDSGITVENDPKVRAFARNDAVALPNCNPDQKLEYVVAAEAFICSAIVLSDATMRSATVEDAINDAEVAVAPSQNAVFDALADKQNIIDASSDITMKYLKLMTDGAFWVGFKAPISTAGNVLFTLPSTQGTSGQVLKTDGAGNLSWITVSTDSSSISDGSIVDADISTTADIDQSKILNLTTDLAGKENTIAAGVAGQYWAPNKTWQTLSTDVVSEGTNKYFTDTLARAAISGTTPLSYNSTTGVMSLSTIPTSLGGTGLTSPGTSGNILQSNGTSWVSWTPNYLTAVPNLDASKITTGVLPVARGGTNTSTLTGNRIMVSSSTAIGEAAALTNGQLLIGSTGASPVAANVTAGSGVTITNSAGGISISATGSGGTVTSVSGTAPVSVATGTTTPVISMAAASGAADGYLTSANWTTFNNKQAALSNGATINGIVYPANGTQTLQIPLAPVNASDAVNKQYVDSFGQWLINSGNIYRASGNVGIGVTVPEAKIHLLGSRPVTGADATVEELLKLSRNGPLDVGTGLSKGSHFSIGLSYYENPGNHYPRTRADFKTTGKDTDDQTTPMTLMSLRDDGRVGIGTINPASPLHVEKTYTVASSGEEYGNFTNTSFGAPSSNWKAGFRTNTRPTLSSGTLSKLVGHQSLISSGASGGTTTEGMALWGRIDVAIGQIMTNAYGLYIENGGGTGNAGNQYGLFIQNLTSGSTENFAVYTQGNTKSYFGGNVGIGTQAPTTKLEVNGTVKATNFQGTLNGIKMGAGEFVFADGACGDTVATACSVSIASVGFAGVPACTITMRNRDATSYTEKMVIKDITASAITIWRGNYQDAGTTMQGYWTCMGN